MKTLQTRVRLFCEKHQLECPPEHRLLDLVSELGEVSKEVLKATSYGKTPFETTPEFEEELGDTLFSLLALANSTGTDLESALETVLRKYGKRASDGSGPGSKLK